MLAHMNLLGFFHTEKPKKKFFELPNNQKPKTPKPQNPDRLFLLKLNINECEPVVASLIT
jgi:hypothetical protein